MLTTIRRSAVLAALTVAVSGTTVTTAWATENATACAAMNTTVSQRIDDAGQAALLTAGTPTDVDVAAYPQDIGPVFATSTARGDGLTAVKLLTNPRNEDMLYVLDRSEAVTAVSKYHYEDQGVAFWASATPLDCAVPVSRYLRGAMHRQAVGDEGAALVAAGWVKEGVSFYAVPATGTPVPPPAPAPDTDTTFTLAITPDTQQEVGTDDRFRQRNQWLVDNADRLDLRFVGHTGDVVNWDTPEHAQYEVASNAMRPLEEAGIPYQLSIGNHDSQATGPGGSARDSKRTRVLARDTSVFNSYFTAARYGAIQGAFEAGKVDNVYSSFSAAGKDWIVLSLEIWPRTEAVDWARDVVASHPKSNVIVLTHSYLDADGSIAQSSNYGANSPQYVYDRLISQYPNIKLVFTGHTGLVASRSDVGINGNVVRSFATHIHSSDTNPVRLVEIDTAANTLSTQIVAPWNDAATWAGFNQTLTLDWN